VAPSGGTSHEIRIRRIREQLLSMKLSCGFDDYLKTKVLKSTMIDFDKANKKGNIIMPKSKSDIAKRMKDVRMNPYPLGGRRPNREFPNTVSNNRSEVPRRYDPSSPEGLAESAALTLQELFGDNNPIVQALQGNDLSTNASGQSHNNNRMDLDPLNNNSVEENIFKDELPVYDEKSRTFSYDENRSLEAIENLEGGQVIDLLLAEKYKMYENVAHDRGMLARKLLEEATKFMPSDWTERAKVALAHQDGDGLDTLLNEASKSGLMPADWVAWHTMIEEKPKLSFLPGRKSTLEVIQTIEKIPDIQDGIAIQEINVIKIFNEAVGCMPQNWIEKASIAFDGQDEKALYELLDEASKSGRMSNEWITSYNEIKSKQVSVPGRASTLEVMQILEGNSSSLEQMLLDDITDEPPNYWQS